MTTSNAKFAVILAGMLTITGTAKNNAQESRLGQPDLRKPASPGGRVVADNCSVKLINDVNIPAVVEGKLVELNLEEGMNISKGDVIAVVDDTAAKLTLNLKLAEEKEAMLNADNDVNLRDATASRKVAEAEADSFRELYDKGAVPYHEMRKKVLEADRGDLRIELAEMQRKIAQTQYIVKRNEREIAEYEQDRRKITAPFDGYIETRVAQLGEWVQPGSPIATLVQLDRVRVEGVVDALAFPGRVHAGMPVTVKIFASSNRDDAIEVDSELGFVSAQLNLRGQYRVWTDIANVRDDRGGWIAKPGMQAEIIFK